MKFTVTMSLPDEIESKITFDFNSNIITLTDPDGLINQEKFDREYFVKSIQVISERFIKLV